MKFYKTLNEDVCSVFYLGVVLVYRIGDGAEF